MASDKTATPNQFRTRLQSRPLELPDELPCFVVETVFAELEPADRKIAVLHVGPHVEMARVNSCQQNWHE